jgi:hypothetical protein
VEISNVNVHVLVMINKVFVVVFDFALDDSLVWDFDSSFVFYWSLYNPFVRHFDDALHWDFHNLLNLTFHDFLNFNFLLDDLFDRTLDNHIVRNVNIPLYSDSLLDDNFNLLIYELLLDDRFIFVSVNFVDVAFNFRLGMAQDSLFEGVGCHIGDPFSDISLLEEPGLAFFDSDKGRPSNSSVLRDYAWTELSGVLVVSCGCWPGINSLSSSVSSANS